MKLYFFPGACSLAVHIALREARLAFDLEEVDYATRRIRQGGDYKAVNPKGYVPGLLTSDGWLLTEVTAILDFIAERVPEASLAPTGDLKERSRYREWQSFIATEIHKSFSPLFRPTTPKAFLAPGRAHLVKRLATVESHLRCNEFIMGPAFFLLDAYLFTLCRWLKDQEMSLEDWPALERHFNSVGARPTVKSALRAEGL